MRVHFAGVKAVDDVTLELRRGELLGLIGPNGAGKTTLVNALTGFQRVTRGRTHSSGQDTTNWSPQRLARHGVTRTFQGVRLFAALSALENVEAAGMATGLRRHEARPLAMELLERLHLDHVAHRSAAALPFGDERRLGVARALATRPRFLLLDEPAAGLNEHESDVLIGSLRTVRDDFGCGLLIIDHDMRLIMGLCERVQVLDYGRTIFTGLPEEVRRDPTVLTAYLGSAGEGHADR